MEILTQGMVGRLDLFIHPQYISTNGPIGMDLGLCYIIVAIVGVFVLLVIFQNWYKKVQEKRALDAQLDAEMEERTGP